MSHFAVRSLLSSLILGTIAFAGVPATAQTFSVLHTFTGGADGALPSATLVMDQAGNLYGTATAGGTGLCSYSAGPGCGTIFQLKNHNSSWIFNPLYSFQGGTDGEAPVRPLTLGSNGTYYGTTLGGGEGICETFPPECGVVFNAGPNPQPPRTPLLTFRESVLYSFSGGSDGGLPYSTIVFDQIGNIYGTTEIGGANNRGTVFKLSPVGGGKYTETVLYSFCPQSPCPDGTYPLDGVIFDSAGNLYGTTNQGGANGFGAVFELSPSGSGWTERVIYSFQGGFDGANPFAGVAMDSAGNLYGNTYYGGTGGGGTVYELTSKGSNWNFNLLYSPPNRGGAMDRVTFDSRGNLYESLLQAGAFGYGQVLELAHSGSNWTYIDLHDFTDGSDGAHPAGGVMPNPSGNLYGTAQTGGGTGCSGEGCGVVWEITP